MWSEEEYAKLPDFDELETARQPPSAFLCHQQDGRLCAGWVAVHDMNESLGLRLLAALYEIPPEDFDAILDYTTDVPLFATGSEAAAHGLAELKDPSPSARALIARLERKALAAARRHGAEV